ncbi:MAG: hypothetical protein GY851_21430 [bacterium]|nr:hypothetical protein [bacterium]
MRSAHVSRDRFAHRSVLTHLALLFLVPGVALCGVAKAVDTYQHGPGITGKIHLTDGERWAHVNDTTEWCSVQVYDTIDIDCMNGEELPGSYYSFAVFNGGDRGNCDPAWHVSTTNWYATQPGQSVVTATLVDHPQEPDEDANESFHPEIILGQDPANGDFCAGFTVKIEGNISGAWVQTDWTVTEGSTDSKTMGAASWVGPAAAQGNGTNTNTVTDSCQQSAEISWTFKTVPSHAEPRKNIKAKLNYVPTAEFLYNIEDTDRNDGTTTFGVTLSYVVGIEYVWNLPDSREGSWAGVWQYTGDGVGGNRATSAPDFTDTSSLYEESSIPVPGGKTEAITGNAMAKGTGAGYVSRAKGETVNSSYIVSNGVAAVDPDLTQSWATGNVRFSGATFSVQEVTY